MAGNKNNTFSRRISDVLTNELVFVLSKKTSARDCIRHCYCAVGMVEYAGALDLVHVLQRPFSLRESFSQGRTQAEQFWHRLP
jgi:hypothetical protein